MENAMSLYRAEELISLLGLTQHPEGGWFRETYRAAETLPAAALPDRFGGDRSFSTAIYFLLAKGDTSAFHRIKSDELWHFHAGTTLTIHIFSPAGEYHSCRLGSELAAGDSFQVIVPARCWFGAEVTGAGEFTLTGCTVAPGFDFADFEMAERQSLLAQFPAHGELIRRLTCALD
jgi:predicted cupin superfamily sugar epimerase